MGHTTRIIPIINKYLKNGYKITVAVNKFQKEILQNEVENIEYVELQGYNVELSTSKNQIISILKQIPKILTSIKNEKQFVSNYLHNNNNVDLIISDNRYGFRNKNVESIIITHQTYIKTPLKIKLFEIILNKINTKIINKFNICWIPDSEGDNNISGELSHKNTKINNIKYIGILSRYKKLPETEKTNKLLAILSGPEPQRTIFEDIIIQELNRNNYKSIIVRGTNKNTKQNTDNIEFINIANTIILQGLINKSEQIISRSGYSSIMDYISIQRTAILVPTPGQTEQEYLANYLSQKKSFLKMEQDNINLTFR